MKTCGLLCFLAMLTIPAWGRSHKPGKQEAAFTDPGYVSALAAANRFLHAWQTGDLENGVVLLSDGIRRSQNADKLEEFFAAPSERSYEIALGRRRSGRYAFPVVLVTVQSNRIVRRASEIILVNTGKKDWAVDKLP